MTAVRATGVAAHGFDFLSDPVLVVTLHGDIVETNEPANALFGSKLDHGRLGMLLECQEDGGSQYLRLASRSTAPRPGKFLFAMGQGASMFRTEAARSRQGGGGETRIILRILPPTSDRFALIDRRVKDIDAQLHTRLKEIAALQEALRKNRALQNELQHRVKNNIHQMMTLIKISAGPHSAPEVTKVVTTAQGRLHAMAAAQEAIYRASESNKVPSRRFLEEVVQAAAGANGASGAISMSLDDALLSGEEAHCLALIVNELVTNAAKHALRDGQGQIAVTFADAGDTYRLDVEDTGPGIPVDVAMQASGLALVRGLCRQIGARLEVADGDDGSGATCSVHFRPFRQQEEDA